MAQQLEGNVDDELRKWLQSWDLQRYEQKLREQGIKKPKDFIFVKSKQHFDGLISSLGSIPFLDKLKFEDAWKSIVPKPEKPDISIHFLEKEDKEIMKQLYQRFDDLSQDITNIKKAFNDFNQSAVISKKKINDNASSMILAVNTKKEELLQKINNLQQKSQNKFQTKLDMMETMNNVCLQSKNLFNQIAITRDVTSTQRTNKLKKLLSMNTVDTSNDDEKQNEMKENYDHYSYIGHECVIPGKIVTIFDKNQFNNVLQSCFQLKCDDITSKWNLKQYYVSGIDSKWVKFSGKFKSKGDVFRIDNAKGTVHHISSGGFHYILTDSVPVYEGIHTWRVKMENQKDVFWGICEPKSCRDRALEETTFFGIGQYGNYVSVAGNYSNHSPNSGVSPFKKESVVIDIQLNFEKHTLEFHLVDENNKHIFKMDNIPEINNPEKGYVLCFCLRYNDQSVQVAKIDNQACGKWFGINAFVFE